jgi:hypothetical protein
VLRTDHDNLKYINQHPSQKVMRWKLAMSEYDCDIEHIKGVDNHVADAMSRLIENSSSKNDNTNESDSEDEHVVSAIPLHATIPKRTLRMIQACHNEVVGHHGERRTLAKILQQFKNERHDPNLSLFVREFVQKCAACQKLSQIKPLVRTHPFTTSTRTPMDMISLDTIGPFPADQFDNRYIIVMIDCFSKFVEVSAVKDTTAKTAASALVEYTGRYGTPSRILTDNGTQFVNELITEVTDNALIQHMKIVPYSHQENAIVERANKEVLRHLRTIVFHKSVYHDWAENLPMIQRIMNSEVHQSTGVSPAQIIFGNSIQLDKFIFHPPGSLEEEEHESDLVHRPSTASSPHRRLSDWMAKMLANQAHLVRIAQESLDERDAKHKTVKQLRFPPTSYDAGTYVLLRPPEGQATKFSAPWHGPYKVIQTLRDGVQIQNLVNHKTRVVHIQQLKPFLYDPHTLDPKSVAMRDYHEFAIDRILEHRGNPRDKTRMSFLVRWLGYGEEDDTWADWGELRATDQLHDYLRQQGLRTLIPRNYREVQLRDQTDDIAAISDVLKNDAPAWLAQEDIAPRSIHMDVHQR